MSKTKILKAIATLDYNKKLKNAYGLFEGNFFDQLVIHIQSIEQDQNRRYVPTLEMASLEKFVCQAPDFEQIS